MAQPSEDKPKDFSPRALATSTTPVITAALSTDGVGLTRNINTSRKTKTNCNLTRKLTTKYFKTQSRKVATNTKLAPLTAVK